MTKLECLQSEINGLAQANDLLLFQLVDLVAQHNAAPKGLFGRETSRRKMLMSRHDELIKLHNSYRELNDELFADCQKVFAEDIVKIGNEGSEPEVEGVPV